MRPSSYSPPSAFNGLDALVHAATEEQKRLSASDDRRMSSRSPVVGYPTPVSPHRHHHHHHTSYDPYASEYPKRGTGMLVPVDEIQSRPPIKRQRLSDPGERYAQSQSALPMRLSGPGAHAYPVNDRAILGIGSGDSRRAEEDRVPSRRTSSASRSREERSVEAHDTTSRPPTPRETEANKPAKPPPKEQPEQDAHEWLLEHYAGSSSIPTAKAQSASGKSEGTRSRTPAPEIATALEQELEDAAGPSVHKPETDPDVALAESLDVEGAKSDRVSMEVDDELLSLVDDPAPAPAPAPAPPPTQRYPYAAPPPSLRLSKPLTPTVVTVVSPAFASPAPVSPFQPTSTPERGSMPPPPTTHITGKGGVGKKTESAAMKGKKAAKVCTSSSYFSFT